MTISIEDHSQEVLRIIGEGLLHPVFQPILDFRARAYLGFEALIRGPANSPCIVLISCSPPRVRPGSPVSWSMPVAKPVCALSPTIACPGVSFLT